MTHLNFLAKWKLTAPLWELWRDLTWCRSAKKEWLAKMNRYRSKNLDFAEARAKYILDDRPTDWDDNIPKSWAREFLKTKS